MKYLVALVFHVTWLLGLSDGFYVPGVAPVEYTDGSPIEVKAVKMTSTMTQLPYDYYTLPFCRPPKGIVYKSENLGEVLRGDRIVNTPYEVNMKTNVSCKVLCTNGENSIKMLTWDGPDLKKVIEMIREEYIVHLIVDNLPCATMLWTAPENGKLRYGYTGYRLGYVLDNKVYINNHLNLILHYHTVSKDEHRVVGFAVEAKSVDLMGLSFGNNQCFMDGKNEKAQELVEPSTNLVFSYSVSWVASNVSWASRWDIYLEMTDVEIHWYSIVHSLAVIIFLFATFTGIMIRTLRRDIARYNSDEFIEEALEESGWKLVHGDVFRPPRNTRFFAAVIGSGIQILIMALITLFFAMLGMLSPASRGALMTAAIMLYVFSGLIAGYISARLYKTMKGREWKRTAFLTATFYPGIVFGVCFFLNFFIWGKHSSGAVPFSTMVALLVMWFGVSLPLVYLGYFFGYRKQPFAQPVRTNQIPRQVPDQVWYMNPILCVLMAGMLPFAVVFIELSFIFTAIWQNQIYYMFGFLFLVFLILVISCAEISLVVIYFQLCGEDYNWWWRSMMVPGGSAIYVFIYSVFYFFSNLQITEFIPTLLYFSYTLLMVLTFWLLTGTIGFFAAYSFIIKIYGAVKID
ncbi:transmembrane 9 superfamily member 4 [Cimex lectularius]|uniref:Transmembrane 9 superfamily member n=1 Tax=Cimex lectularius TaxID=79782 RepID=A0A8I6TGG1_CIMLE|nr:transmembrane 9 superfamily member 4 [Cimex lectularius]